MHLKNLSASAVRKLRCASQTLNDDPIEIFIKIIIIRHGNLIDLAGVNVVINFDEI